MVRRRIAAVAATALIAATLGCQDAEVEARLQELAMVSAQKDSLLQEVLENTQFMSEVSTELAKVQGVVMAPESPSGELLMSRDSILTQIRDLTLRVTEGESRLDESEARVRSLASRSDSLREVATEIEGTMADMRAMILTQKQTIDQLTLRVSALSAENDELMQEVVALVDTVLTLEDTVTALADRANTVYYVVGSKDDLKERGLVAEEGSKFLFFGKKALVPAREFNPDQFTAINRMEQTEIELPDSTKRYRIVSRQSLAHLSGEVTDDGKVSGSIVIADPLEFWEPSRFLIVVED